MKRVWTRVLIFSILIFGFGLVAGGPLSEVVRDETTGASEQNATATVTFISQNGTTLGHITGSVANTRSERHTGLSETDSLEPNEGMIFVFPDTDERGFVMRNMSFPIDIIFVDGDGVITAIHHAAVDDDDVFDGEARWVIEVNRGYTDAHNVSVGDRVKGLSH